MSMLSLASLVFLLSNVWPMGLVMVILAISLPDMITSLWAGLG